MIDHVGDDAESYALGLLEPQRRAQIDAHLAGCADCQRLIGDAEETAAALAGTLPAVRPSTDLRDRVAAIATKVVPLRREGLTRARLAGLVAGLAVAAALLLALATSWYQAGSLRGKLQGDDLAVATLVHSHFLHVTMNTSAAGGSLAAKVIYARDGSWLYVLVDRPDGALDVTATIDGKSWAGGRVVAEGETATLFVRPPGRPQRVELTRDGVTLARATLAY